MAAGIAVVGAGLIGRAWAVAFARGGREVALWDPVDGAAAASVEAIPAILEDLAAADMLAGQAPATVRGRIRVAATLEDVLAGAVHVQENAPERLEVKKALYTDLDRLADPGATLASSTSSLLPSAWSEHVPNRHRCLVAHPINPPFLIPAVEVVPAPWTEPSVVGRCRDLLASIGQQPIVMRKEIDGFLMNRLQGALLARGLPAGRGAAMPTPRTSMRHRRRPRPALVLHGPVRDHRPERARAACATTSSATTDVPCDRPAADARRSTGGPGAPAHRGRPAGGCRWARCQWPAKVIITCAVTGAIHTPSMSPHLPVTRRRSPRPRSAPPRPAPRSSTCMPAIPRTAGPTRRRTPSALPQGDQAALERGGQPHHRRRAHHDRRGAHAPAAELQARGRLAQHGLDEFRPLPDARALQGVQARLGAPISRQPRPRVQEHLRRHRVHPDHLRGERHPLRVRVLRHRPSLQPGALPRPRPRQAAAVRAVGVRHPRRHRPASRGRACT
jgi:hypothetical protein